MNACVKCGFCCTQGPCSYGSWSPGSKRCVFLTWDTLCTKYSQIRKIEANSPYPMFGCGCCSPLFNEMREAKLRKLKGVV